MQFCIWLHHPPRHQLIFLPVNSLQSTKLLPYFWVFELCLIFYNLQTKLWCMHLFLVFKIISSDQISKSGISGSKSMKIYRTWYIWSNWILKSCTNLKWTKEKNTSYWNIFLFHINIQNHFKYIFATLIGKKRNGILELEGTVVPKLGCTSELPKESFHNLSFTRAWEMAVLGLE